MLPQVDIPQLQLIMIAGARKRNRKQMQTNKMNHENTKIILVH